MGKRYGRNQRRAARQALADAVANAQQREAGMQLDIRMLSERLHEAKEGLDYITEAVRGMNLDSTLLPPETLKVSPPSSFRRADERPGSSSFLDWPEPDCVPLAWKIHDLVHVVTRIEKCDLRQQLGVHLYLEGLNERGEKEWRYVIDTETFQRRGIHPAELRGIAEHVARTLVLSLECTLPMRRR